jgi:hypothetical protein
MRTDTKKWFFYDRRGKLTAEEVEYFKQSLSRLLKVGIEVELNLPQNEGICKQDNYVCKCVSVFKPEKRMPNTESCFEQCANWDSSVDASGAPLYAKDGNCAIAKEHGCFGHSCAAFKSPCPSCSKYDRGCNTCPQRWNPKRDPNAVRNNISKLLKPSGFVGDHGEYGIYKVVEDGSLLGPGGVEVITVGKRPQFSSIHDMMKRVINTCKAHGAYTNERCSVHMHLLASYLTPNLEGDRGPEYLKNELTELEKPIPEVILANFHQLVRRYQTALIWLGASGTSKANLTRWEKFRKSILNFSAVRHRMQTLAKEVGQIGYKPKYALMNYVPTRFDDNGDVRVLHLEARYMDGMLSPSVIAAHSTLMYGLMIKAVEMSRYGVLESGDKDYMTLQKEIMQHLCNGDGGFDSKSRLSDTRGLDPYIPILIEQSKQLIRLVKKTLTDQAPADTILMSLAEKPVALRLIEGQTWDQIEMDLAPKTLLNPVITEVRRIIDTDSITECLNEKEWHEAVLNHLSSENENTRGLGHLSLAKILEKYLADETSVGKIYWSKDTGSYESRS